MFYYRLDFGLQGRKGIIAPGADADIVIFNPDTEHILGASSHHMALDHSVWEGIKVQGQSESVLSRGSFVIQDRHFVGRARHGEFLKRSLPEPLR